MEYHLRPLVWLLETSVSTQITLHLSVKKKHVRSCSWFKLFTKEYSILSTSVYLITPVRALKGMSNYACLHRCMEISRLLWVQNRYILPALAQTLAPMEHLCWCKVDTMALSSSSCLCIESFRLWTVSWSSSGISVTAAQEAPLDSQDLTRPLGNGHEWSWMYMQHIWSTMHPPSQETIRNMGGNIYMIYQ